MQKISNFECGAVQKCVDLVDLIRFSNEYSIAKIGVDTAENEPRKVADSAAGENTEFLVSRLLRADLVIPSQLPKRPF